MNNKEIDMLIKTLDNYKNLSQPQIRNMVCDKFKKVNFKLYKYYSLTSEYTFSNIENDVIYLNNASAFNDPFDCYLGYSYNLVIKDICLNLILENAFEMDEFALEAFTKFILCEELPVDDKIFFNQQIKKYGKEFSNLTIDSWINSDIEQRLPLLCNLLVDEGRSLAGQIIEYSHTMIKLQNNIRKTIDDNFIITCFSESFDNQLMWAHYADSHRGICVEYDLSTEKDADINYMKLNLFPVKYSKIRPQIPIKLTKVGQFHYKLSEGKYTIADRYRYLLTKGLEWKYEREWRLILQEKQPRIRKFPLISKIFLGANVSIENKCKIEKLANDKSVTCLQLYPAMNDYKLLV